MLLPSALLFVLCITVPIAVWIVTRGQRHLNRPFAWSIGLPAAIFALLQLEYIVSGKATSDAMLLVHALDLAGWSSLSGLMLGWLFRTRHGSNPS